MRKSRRFLDPPILLGKIMWCGGLYRSVFQSSVMDAVQMDESSSRQRYTTMMTASGVR